MTVDVYFSLGSNVGDRIGNLETALKMMDEAFGVRYSRLSSFIETEAWGFVSEKFMNCAVLYRLERTSEPSDIQAHGILDAVKSIERAMGRTGSVQFDGEGRRIYHSRIIDIDILLFGDEEIRMPDLVIPHALMTKRDFVMVPLREIADPALFTKNNV